MDITTRFHDFRRTTARDLSRAGSPDRIAMSIMGHKARSIYDRSNIVNEGDIAQALRKRRSTVRTVATIWLHWERIGGERRRKGNDEAL
jgi:hypothetical protein